jgi:hypothetical protein
MSDRRVLVLGLLIALLLTREAVHLWRRAHGPKGRGRKRDR